MQTKQFWHKIRSKMENVNVNFWTKCVNRCIKFSDTLQFSQNTSNASGIHLKCVPDENFLMVISSLSKFRNILNNFTLSKSLWVKEYTCLFRNYYQCLDKWFQKGRKNYVFCGCTQSYEHIRCVLHVSKFQSSWNFEHRTRFNRFRTSEELILAM